jgi:hypothetical protein
VKRRRDESVPLSAVFGLPAEVGMRVAAKALKLSLGTAYKRARRGDFPCRLHRRGRIYFVAVHDLMRGLGIQDVRVRYDDIEEGARLARGESDGQRQPTTSRSDAEPSAVKCPLPHEGRERWSSAASARAERWRHHAPPPAEGAIVRERVSIATERTRRLELDG